MNHMICGHSYVYWDVRYECDPCLIHHSNQCRPFQIKTFHTINSVFSTWKQTVSTSPQIHANKSENTNKKKEKKRRQFYSGAKVIGITNCVWCDNVSIPMLVHPDMLIFFSRWYQEHNRKMYENDSMCIVHSKTIVCWMLNSLNSL